jgi:hypothetical protein
MRVLPIGFLLAASVAFANMEVQNGKMSANLNSEPLTSVLQSLEKQTGMKVSIEPNAANQNVSASFSNLPVAAGIKKILEGTGINYVVVADGDKPTALFIGGSLNPDGSTGAANVPNNMPGRGVVTPVAPLPPPAPPPEIRGVQPDNRQGRRPAAPSVTVPTGGGFVPNTTSPNRNNNQNNPNNNQQINQPGQTQEDQAVEDDEQDEQEQ